MSNLAAIGSLRPFNLTQATRRAQHLQEVSNRLNGVSARLAARGNSGAAEHVANVATRVATRASVIESAVRARAPQSMPPVVQDDTSQSMPPVVSEDAELTGKGSLIDITA